MTQAVPPFAGTLFNNWNFCSKGLQIAVVLTSWLYYFRPFLFTEPACQLASDLQFSLLLGMPGAVYFLDACTAWLPLEI